MPADTDHLRDLVWVTPAKKALSKFPETVQKDVLAAVHIARAGGKSEAVKVLSGFGDAGVLEVIENHRGDTYRAVYTIRFVTAIYVIHAFKKKSKEGVKTPKHEMDLIESRMKQIEELHRKKNGGGGGNHGKRSRT